MKKALLILSLILVCAVSFAANPVTVAASGGDFTSVAAAISSFASGGANASETPPFIVNIDPAGGPYTEQIDLDDANVGTGDVQGNLVVQSSVAGTYAQIILLVAPTSGADDGLMVHQDSIDVTFRDLLLCPSIAGTANEFTDEIVKLDENTANTDWNTITFDHCILTEIDAAGAPLVTSRADAYTAGPPAAVGSARTGFAYALQYWGDTGESINLVMDDCVVFGNIQNSALRISFPIAGQVDINDTMIAYGGYIVRVGSGDTVGTVNITGTDQTAGPDSASVILQTAGADNHCFWFSGSAQGTACNVSGTMMIVEGTNAAAAGSATRGFSGSATVDLTLADCLIVTDDGPGVVDGFENDATWDRVTIVSKQSANALFGVGGAGSLTVRDSIFTGPGAKFASTALPTGGIDIDYCGFYGVTDQVDPALVGVTLGSNIVTTNPQFAEATDWTSADFLDVGGMDYKGADSAGGDLVGGANAYTITAARSAWSIYQ